MTESMTISSPQPACVLGQRRPNVHGLWTFRAEKCKKHARTLRERGAPKVSKMEAIFIFLFSTIYYATTDILVSSDNYSTQEDSCRCNLALVRFSYGLLNFKKDFKTLDVPAACKQIASTGLLLSWTFLQKATI